MQGDISPLDLFVIQQKIIKHKENDESSPSSYSPEPTNEGILRVLNFEEIYEAYNDFLFQCNMIDKNDIVKAVQTHAACDDSEKDQGKVKYIRSNSDITYLHPFTKIFTRCVFGSVIRKETLGCFHLD